MMGGGDTDGTLRKDMVVTDSAVFKAPSGLTFEEASTVFSADVPAFNASYHGANPIRPGMTVLTQGTGGVSCYAIMVNQYGVLDTVYRLLLPLAL